MQPLPFVMAGIGSGPLDGALRTAGWLDFPYAEKAPVAIYDFVNVGSPDAPITLLFLAIAHADEPAAFHFLPVSANTAACEPAADDTATAADLLRHIVTKQSIPTCRGNLIRLTALLPDAVRPETIEPLATNIVASSNKVSGVTIAGRRCLHKTYRRLDPNNNEPKVVRAFSNTAYDTWVPRFLLGYEYADRVSGRVYPLGLVSEYFDGLSFDQALGANVKALWYLASRNEAADSLRTALREHVRPLAALLERAGRFLFSFHTELAARFGGTDGAKALPFAVDRFAKGCTVQAARLSREIQRDHALPADLRRQFAGLLRKKVEAALGVVLATQTRSLQAGFCHGDFHLSHLLLRPEGSDWQMRVVDVSTPCLDRRAPEFMMQCAWQDLIALQRGLEYFIGDELCDELARVLSISPEEASRRRAFAAVRPCSPYNAESRAAVRAEAAAELWCRFVLGWLMRGYAASAAPVSNVVAGGIGWRLFYLARLMHELEYNMRHDRFYFRCMDYYYMSSMFKKKSGKLDAYS